jgi:hypothetical protein
MGSAMRQDKITLSPGAPATQANGYFIQAFTTAPPCNRSGG